MFLIQIAYNSETRVAAPNGAFGEVLLKVLVLSRESVVDCHFCKSSDKRPAVFQILPSTEDFFKVVVFWKH